MDPYTTLPVGLGGTGVGTVHDDGAGRHRGQHPHDQGRFLGDPFQGDGGQELRGPLCICSTGLFF